VNDSADPVRKVPRIPRVKNLDYYRRENIPIRCVNGLVKTAEPNPQASSEKM
jgi:hypothetical protein